MSNCYRLYTEFNGNLEKLASKYFEGFTLLDGGGYWRGQYEACTVIEIITDDDKHVEVEALATLICELNNQTAVMTTHHKVNGGLVFRPDPH